MSYEAASAGTGESPIYHGRLHWVGYLPGILLLLIGAACAFVPILAGLFVLVGSVLLIRHFIANWTTEIVVTDRRVIYKTGLIRRNTVELSARKVEGVDVQQSIPGRIFNYGDLTIRGTGVGEISLKSIANPLDARRALNVG
jgi:uncharacterized membrane protein YdbT with pleckstrin-like domain